MVVVPATDGLPTAITARLADVQQWLADGGLPLAVAVSITVLGLAEIPDVYREASMIRTARGATFGVVALSELSVF